MWERTRLPAAVVRMGLILCALLLVLTGTALLELRVPGIPLAERDAVARTCISILESALLDAAIDDARRAEIVDEAAYAIAAYLAMKYPFEDSPRWRQPMDGLPPSRISVK